MSESDQFRQYAEEALLWAAQSKTKEEKGPTIQEPRKDIGLAAGA